MDSLARKASLMPLETTHIHRTQIYIHMDIHMDVHIDIRIVYPYGHPYGYPQIFFNLFGNFKKKSRIIFAHESED